MADIGLAQGVALAGGPIHGLPDSAALPVDQAFPLPAGQALHAIDILPAAQIGGQGLTLERLTDDGGRPRGQVVVGRDRQGGRAADALRRALTIDVAQHHPNGITHFGQPQLVMGVGACRQVQPAAQAIGLGVALPLNADGSQAVDIGQVLAQAQHLIAADAARDDDMAGGGVVDVRHRQRRLAAHLLGCALAVGVTRHHPNGLPHMGLRQQPGGAGPEHGLAHHPGMAQHPQPIGVVQGIRDRQHLPLLGIAQNAHRPRGRIVHVGHQGGGAAGHGFARALPIGVLCHHPDGLAHMGLREQQRGTSPQHGITRHPGVVQRPQAIGIDQGGHRGQQLPLHGMARYRHRPCGQVVDVDHQRRRAARHRLGLAKFIHIRRRDRDRAAHMGLRQHQAAARAQDIAATSPGIGDRPAAAQGDAIWVADGVAGRQGLALFDRAGDGHGPGGGIVRIEHQGTGLAHHLFVGAL